ncbi:MAG: FAD-dependent thymidylate synthase [Alphaproteobacteria bacterium]|nr:FAD-dependent thymidylate synthase [Alphaproteobacteria bacterium]
MERIRVTALDNILGEKLPVLDKGFIRVVDYMGDDSSIVQAARVSYGKGTTTPEKDKALLDYLLRHWHTSPFEMCEIKLHLKMPIFIARQWVRHRTANINEFSARYSFVPEEAYIPEENHLGVQSEINHQATVLNSLTPEEARAIRQRIIENTKHTYDTYLWAQNRNHDNTDKEHNEHQGLSRELARINLSLNHYTEWYWKCDLHNLLHFLHLRDAPGAQLEIQRFAQVIIEKILKVWVPWTYESFVQHRQHAVQFSQKSQAVLHDLVNNNPVKGRESYGLSSTEWREFWEKLQMPDPQK